MTSNHQSNGWRFWAAWGLAFLGFPLGGLASIGLVGGLASIGLVGGVESVLDGAIGGAACGAVLGAVQWLVLRRRLSLPRSWIMASSLGMAGGLALTVALVGTSTAGSLLLLRGVTTGLVIGLAQWIVLRGSVPRAWVWVPTIATGWALGWAVSHAIGLDLTPNFAVFGASGALAFQALTGLVLAWLLSQRAAPRGPVELQPV
jgi:hypothetical protein